MTKADAKKPNAALWQSVSAPGRGRRPLKLSPKKLGKYQIMALAQKKSMGDRHGIWIKETTLLCSIPFLFKEKLIG